ncbi:uncharacterized protein EI90DRAFT_3119809 [Cantharellus anzutake]|uniref:uncharacterized protein n=1 Tax=Cantharellus anzutake TaxID=1750568 RepID=UPI0019085DFE|nr:uncharacterized protein EI90DRAFT_3119809 [Cantharellus anzutake]KAF8336556.1 hypothetical protein EI90DRAFT_3119809 [Cantharellus anzutake]
MAPTTTTTTGVGQMNDPRRGYLASPNNSFDQSLRLGQTTRPPVLHHTSFPTSSGRLGVSAHPPPVDGPFSGGTGFGQSNSLSPLGSDPWSTSSSKAPVYTPPRQPSLLSHSFDSHNEFIIPRIEDPSIGNVSLAASSSNVSRNPSARPGSSSSSDSAVHSQLRQSTGNGSSSSSSSNGLFIYDTHAPSLRTFQLTTPSAPPSPTPNPAQQSHSSVSPAKPHACKTCGATFQRGHDCHGTSRATITPDIIAKGVERFTLGKIA